MSRRSVTVAGSGAAGMAAALAAARSGARVTVLESAARLGGTTCLSGGLAWTPADSAEEGFRYLSSVALGDVDIALCRAYCDGSPEVVLERLGVGMHPVAYPDYHAEAPGGREGGRSYEPDLYQPSARAAELVRDAPNIRAPITYAELVGGGLDRDELRRRADSGVVTLGRALIAALVDQCLELGVEFRTGVEVDAGFTVEGALVLATGGFERDGGLARAFLRGPMLAPTGTPQARGGGLRLAMARGAALGNMSEAWWGPAVSLPGETIDGAPLHRLILTERSRAGAIMVDGSGRRFADEAQNYNDLGRSLHAYDPAANSFTRVPSWLVFDGAYRRTHRFFTVSPEAPDPEWLCRADTLAGLAALIDVPAPALEATVERFNHFAVRGEDPDFGRGQSAYDRFIGGLGPLGDGPYYAARVWPGCLGTKGGPRTDADGQVLDVRGAPIPGLFAAGNAAASPFGTAYPGAGGTIGPALHFGWKAGEAAAS